MIHAEIVGNVGQKPEARESKGGKQMCRFTVASSTKGKDGTSKTSWVTVLCFDEMAAMVAERVGVGDRVMVSGRLEVEKWEKDGVEKTGITVIADDVGISLKWPKREKAAAGKDEDWSSPF
jgi:single-strand DNA-binding protein